MNLHTVRKAIEHGDVVFDLGKNLDNDARHELALLVECGWAVKGKAYWPHITAGTCIKTAWVSTSSLIAAYVKGPWQPC